MAAQENTMHKGKPIIYIDGLGREHEASVVDINQLHPGFITVGYFAEDGDTIKVYDIPHMSHESRQNVVTVLDKNNRPVQQGNPDLPTYPVHCWKERDEEHKALPSDHPAFDHPHKLPEFDQDGARIPIARPEYEADIAASRVPSGADLDAVAAEAKAAEDTTPAVRLVKGSKAK
jgi:hypothetical protein